MQFLWGDHILQSNPRGPFYSSRDWIIARLSFDEHDCNSNLTKLGSKNRLSATEEDNVEDAKEPLQLIRRLKNHPSEFFPVDSENAEPSMLFHDDLSKHNILINDEGALTGVVDWECVSALPLWKACYYPAFLVGRPRDEEPKIHLYGNRIDPNELFWEHLMDYERTKLRRYFVNVLRSLEPEWVRVFESTRRQRDFDYAVQYCSSSFSIRKVNKWLDNLSSKNDS